MIINRLFKYFKAPNSILIMDHFMTKYGTNKSMPGLHVGLYFPYHVQTPPSNFTHLLLSAII